MNGSTLFGLAIVGAVAYLLYMTHQEQVNPGSVGFFSGGDKPWRLVNGQWVK